MRSIKIKDGEILRIFNFKEKKLTLFSFLSDKIRIESTYKNNSE